MLASRAVPAPVPFRVALRLVDLTLHLLETGGGALASLELHGVTLEDAAVLLAGAEHTLGADVSRFTLARHYQIPAHPVLEGAPFDAARAADLVELSDWFANADVVLRELAAVTPGASAVRCWPHHFDIGTVLTVGGPPAGGSQQGRQRRRIGIGMQPGDDSYPEPYFYVSLDPAPRAEATLPSLAGRGRWHVQGWIGAVLTGSRLTPDPAGQRDQVGAFIRSALAACRDALGVA